MAAGANAMILRGVTPASELFVRALRAAWELEWPIIDPEISLQFDISAWEKVSLDDKIAQAIEQRVTYVAAKPWTVVPASEREPDVKLAEVVKLLLGKVKKFHEGRRFLAEAIFRARSYLWIYGQREALRLSSEIPVMGWWFPVELQHKDKREVRWVPEVERSEGRQMIRRRREVWSKNRGEWIAIPGDHEELLLEIVYRDESGRLGYGRGLLEPLYFLWWAKQHVKKLGLQAIERWAQGKLVGKVDSEKPGAPADATTGLIRNQMRTELERLRTHHVAVIDKADSIENVGGGGEGWQMAQEFMKYLDDCALGLALGGVLPFGGGIDKGSMARAETEQESSEELLKYDFATIDEPITRKLIPALFRHNNENLSRLGLLDAGLPTFASTHDRKRDPQKEVEVVGKALQARIPLKKSQVYERIGYDMPTEDDEVFEGAPELAGAGIGFPFGGGAGAAGTPGQSDGIERDRGAEPGSKPG